MIKESRERYRIYEYIRDSHEITDTISSTKKLIAGLIKEDKKIEEYCNRKMLEEKREVEEAILGKHFHKNMTKREILVNEISQYIYWETIVAIAKKVTHQEFDEEERIRRILEKVDVGIIGESKPITVKEVILHDLEQMKSKEYLSEVI